MREGTIKILNEGGILSVLKGLKSVALRTKYSNNLADKAQGLIDNYKFLLQYYASGNDDPQRDNIINKIKQDALFLEQELDALNVPNDKYLKMLDKARTYVPTEDKYSLLKQIFYKTILETEVEYIDYSTSEQKAMYVAALGVNILNRFNEHNILLLCRLVRQYDGKEQIYALIWLLTIYNTKQCILESGIFSTIYDEIKSLSACHELREIMPSLVKHFINLSLTFRVNKQMDGMSKEIMSRIKPKEDETEIMFDIETIDDEEDSPSWGEHEKSDMSQYMDEIAKLHDLGADINYGTIVQLLRTNSFFRQDITNWFLPFGLDNPELEFNEDSKNGKIIKNLIRLNKNACDIDLYAFGCLQKLMQSADGEKKIKININEEDIPIDEFTSLQEDIDFEIANKDYALLYIRSLFRFFFNNEFGIKNAFRQNSFSDFSYDITHIGEYDLVQLFLTDNQLEDLFDYCFSLELYEYCTCLIQPTTAEQYKKIGYAYQNFVAECAPEYYEKVLEFDPDDDWTRKHLAFCLQFSGNIEGALEQYNKLQNTTNKRVLTKKAECLINLERFDEALQVFYQLDLLYPDNPNFWRGLVWCTLNLTNPTQTQYDIALNYSQRLINIDKAESNDYMNYGHLLLITNNRKEAIEKYLTGNQIGERKFNSEIESSKKLLEKHGVSSQDIALVKEAVNINYIDEEEKSTPISRDTTSQRPPWYPWDYADDDPF